MRDINEAAHSAVQTVIDRTEPPRKKSLLHVAVGRLGGLKGGPREGGGAHARAPA